MKINEKLTYSRTSMRNFQGIKFFHHPCRANSINFLIKFENLLQVKCDSICSSINFLLYGQEGNSVSIILLNTEYFPFLKIFFCSIQAYLQPPFNRQRAAYVWAQKSVRFFHMEHSSYCYYYQEEKLFWSPNSTT